MSTALSTRKIERQGEALNIIAKLQDEMPNYKSVGLSKSGMSLNLFTANDEMVSIVLSKNLRAALEAKTITFDQLGQCNIIAGKNADGEERYYLALPAGTNGAESVESLIATFGKAKAITTVGIAQRIHIPQSVANMAL